MTTKNLKITTAKMGKRSFFCESRKVIKPNFQSNPKNRFKDFQPVQYTPMLDQNVSFTDHDATGDPVYYYNQDERQSVRNLSDTTGAVVQSYDYTAYGDKLDSLTTGDVEQRYTYTGRELNEVSGNYYFRYRMYGAGIGGFLSRDMLGYVDGMSVYSGWFATVLNSDAYGTNIMQDAGDLAIFLELAKDCSDSLRTGKPSKPVKIWEDPEKSTACEEAKSRALSKKGLYLNELWKNFGKPGCPEPDILCRCCNRDSFHYRGNNKIYLCWNRIEESNDIDSVMQEILAHEGYHYLQTCKRGKAVDCKEALIREIQSYRCSGGCVGKMDCFRKAMGSACIYCKDEVQNDPGSLLSIIESVSDWWDANGNGSRRKICDMSNLPR